MAGWISLHRKLMDNPIYSNANMLKLWIHCLMKASHSGHDQLIGNQMVKLEIGEFVTGRNALADEFNKGAKKSEVISAITLWRWLKNFEEWQMLNIKTTTKYSVVTVSNWSEHQGREQQVNSKRTTDEQQVNTINKVNKVNNEKNVKKSDPVANISNIEGIKTFVDYAINILPEGLTVELLTNYFDCIRMHRATCRVSENVLKNLVDKMKGKTANQITYAMYTHYTNHDDKPENYTLGILRGTTDESAKQKLDELKTGRRASASNNKNEIDWGAFEVD